MFIIKYKNLFLAFSTLLVAASLVAIGMFGLKLGIDFNGGAITEVVYTGKDIPTSEAIRTSFKNVGLGDVVVQPGDTGSIIIKSKDIAEADRPLLDRAIKIDGTHNYQEKSFSSVGPTVGKELTKKALIAVTLVLICIALFITWSFRGVSKPVASWKYGVITIVTLIHDIIIPIGFFALLEHFRGAEVDTLFVIALLTITGIAISDRIVVFDRIRENLKIRLSAYFPETVGMSLTQTFARSINTSLTVIVVLLALFFLGPEPTKNFSLILVVGMIVGTYSSIFIASPLLVIVERWQQPKVQSPKGK